MNALVNRLLSLLTLASLIAVAATGAYADPLLGRDLLKFSQKPMVATTIADAQGLVQTYGGHDELSTAYGFVSPQPTPVIPVYQGRFMADDFADKLSSPVVHVKWWGSYIKDFINPAMPVDKFLISFESDIPADPANPFSRPGQPLLNQVVFRNPLAPGSGTFTEKLIRGPDPILNESLYEYNAELHLGKEFPEKADTVYWLKIVALVDVPSTLPTFDPNNPPAEVTQWGWHNRDYTIHNPLASGNVMPGESMVGTIGANVPVWHFQDNAIQGSVRISTTGQGGLVMPDVFQPADLMRPQHYLDGIDGPGVPGAIGISQFSKDLAFELYTIVPEPTSFVLVTVGLISAGTLRRRKYIGRPRGEANAT